jgi:hypothetical protein
MTDKNLIDISKRYQSAIRAEQSHVLAQRTEKYCRRCKKILPISAFYPPSVSGITPISGWCRECYRAYEKQRREDRRLRRGKNGRW